MPFSYGNLSSLVDFFHFYIVERQHGNFIFALCFEGGVLGLEKHILMRNMEKKKCVGYKKSMGVGGRGVLLLTATENGAFQWRHNFSRSR